MLTGDDKNTLRAIARNHPDNDARKLLRKAVNYLYAMEDKLNTIRVHAKATLVASALSTITEDAEARDDHA